MDILDQRNGQVCRGTRVERGMADIKGHREVRLSGIGAKGSNRSYEVGKARASRH